MAVTWQLDLVMVFNKVKIDEKIFNILFHHRISRMLLWEQGLLQAAVSFFELLNYILTNSCRTQSKQSGTNVTKLFKCFA